MVNISVISGPIYVKQRLFSVSTDYQRSDYLVTKSGDDIPSHSQDRQEKEL